MVGKILIAALLLAALPQARARDTSLPILFGPEFTFSTSEAPTAWKDFAGSLKIISRQVGHLVEGQPEGAKFERYGNSNFYSPNDWSFTTDADIGVVEVKMKPMTWPEFAHYASDIQDAIFTSAANEGYFPMLFRGGGHINIDVEPLVQEPLLFRNLLADLINHSELFMGILGYDTNNALPFPLFSRELKAGIIEAFELFDRGEIELTELIQSIDNLQRKSGSDRFWTAWGHSGPRAKMYGFSLHHIEGLKGRLELRGVRPQASVDVWVRQIRLLAKRIEFLRRQRRPIPIKVVAPSAEAAEKHLLTPPVNPLEAMHAFHQYVIESGERWEDHKDYLWPKWISDGHVKRYERTDAFKVLQRQSCTRALELANVE
jgi:hypothetical protein